MGVNNFLKSIVLCLIVLSITFCSTQNNPSKEDFPRQNFHNILNIKNIPEKPEDWKAFCFSDLGAWFGFALPGESDKSFHGGFPGPFLMTHGQWLSQCLAKITITDMQSGHKINLEEDENPEINYSPGLLKQVFKVKGLIVNLELCFVSEHTTLTRVKVMNTSKEKAGLRFSWSGDVFMKKAFISKTDNGVIINFEENDEALLSLPASLNVETTITKNNKKYILSINKIFEIDPQSTVSTYLAQSLCPEKEKLDEEKEFIKTVFRNPEKQLVKNRERWGAYLNSAVFVKSKWAKEKEYQNIAVKSVETLVSNWRSASGNLYHAGLFPSYAVWYFNGFWAWDSWKHAVALSIFNPELAKDQIRTMFDYQDSYGMVIDCIFADSTENNLRDSKPPLAAWSVWKVYEATKDKDFVEEMYQNLLKYHEWWYKYRDHDQNGLCEYGSIDGTLEAALWESGWDDAVRFDNALMVQNNEYGWSINQESADLNSYLYAEKLYLASMSELLGDNEKAIELKEAAKKLKIKIQTLMFDNSTGYFYDIKLDDKSFIKVQDPGGWIPLWAKVASKEQAEKVKNVICDTSKFATYIPFPTLAKDHPAFLTGYWRGPVWIDQAYFGIKALKNYGYIAEAEMFTKQLFDRPEGLKGAPCPIRENYDPLTGKGLKVNHFSWSAAHLLLLYLE